MSTKPFSRLAFTLVRLHALAADGNQAKLKFEAKFDADPINALEWAQNTPRALIAGHWASTVIDKCNEKKDGPEQEHRQLEVIRNLLKEVRDQIDRWAPGCSSSPFHNAVEAERLHAMRDVRDTLRLAFEEGDADAKKH